MKTMRVVVITILLTAIIIPVYPIYSDGQDKLPIAGQSFSTIPAEIKQIDFSNMPPDEKNGDECVIFVQKARGILIRDAKKRREGNDNKLPTLTGKSYPGLEKRYSDRGSAFMMYRVAEDEGLHVEKNLPRVGSVLVYDRQLGMPDGHVAIVTKVDYDPDNKTVSLTTRDSNLKGDHRIHTNSLVFMPDSAIPKVRHPNNIEYKILGFVQEEEKAFEKNRSIAENLVREDFLYVLGRDFGNDPKDKMNFYVDRYMQGVERKQVQDYIKVWYADEIQKRNQAVLDYQYSLKKLRDNLIRERASTATDETNKSIFRRTIEGLPEAAKDVFSILTAKASTTFYDASENAITVAQDQSTKNVEDTGTLSTGGGDRPTTHYGYYVGMVTKDDAGSRSYADDVVTDSRQNFDSSNIMVGDNTDTYHILDGSQDYNDPTITSAKIRGKTVISGLPVVVQHGEYGYNTYMEWGYWLLNDLISDGQYNYYVDNKGWYVLGDVTTNTQMDYLAAKNISGTYTGNGYGTYWIGPGGYWNKVIMNGTFSSDVSFSSRTISNFDLSVSGDGHTASISNASGSFSGSSSHFALDGNSGQWKIDGISADADGKGGYGSVYGPNGEAVGGVWGMHNDASNKHAVGMFEGNR